MLHSSQPHMAWDGRKGDAYMQYGMPMSFCYYILSLSLSNFAFSTVLWWDTDKRTYFLYKLEIYRIYISMLFKNKCYKWILGLAVVASCQPGQVTRQIVTMVTLFVTNCSKNTSEKIYHVSTLYIRVPERPANNASILHCRALFLTSSILNMHVCCLSPTDYII